MMRSRRRSVGKLSLSACLVAGLAVLCSCQSRSSSQAPRPEAPEGEGEEGEEPEQAREPDAPPAEDEIPAALAAPRDGPLVVSRSRCEEAGCEIAFYFSHPMVGEEDLEGAPAPEITFDPPQEGSFRWRSPQKLVFEPAEGQLGWGHRVQIRLARATPLAGEGHALPSAWEDRLVVPHFQVAGKVASWPVKRGEPRFIAMLGHTYDGAEIGRGAKFLLYDQPVDPERIARHVRLHKTAGGEAVDVKVERPTSIERVWDGEVDTSAIVSIRGSRLPKDGTKVSLQYPDRLNGDVPRIETRQLTVRTSFSHLQTTLDRTTLSGRAPLDARLTIRFDGAVSAREAKKKIRVRPEPEALQVWGWGENQVALSARLAPGKRYTVVVPPSFRDTLGNRLGVPAKTELRAQDLPPSLSLPKEALVLERGRAQVPLRVTNVGEGELELYRFSDALAFVRALAGGKPSSCAAATGASASAALSLPGGGGDLNTIARREVEVEAEGAPALACVEAAARGRGSEAGSASELRRAALVQLTDLGVTAKVHAGGVAAWVTRLSDAEPVSGARVRLVDPNGKVLAVGRSSDEGIAELSGGGITRRGGLEGRAYLLAEADGDAAAVELADGKLSQPWQFGLSGEVAGAVPLSASVFTERGVYRPGETVHLAAIVRERGGAALRVPKGRGAEMVITDPRGEELALERLRLDRFGTAGAEVLIPEGAAVGNYEVRLSRGERAARASFRVEEYRTPTFEVKVESDQEVWGPDARARALVRADYLSGGELAGRSVEYSVSRVPARIGARDLEGFVFRAPDVEPPAGRIAEGKGRLDGQGRIGIGFSARHEAIAGPMRYVVEASVTDLDRQAYAGRLSRVVHPAGVYVGLKPPPRGVHAAGDVVKVPVVAVTPDGAPRPGIDVTVRLENISHHTVSRLSERGATRESRRVVKPIKRCRVTTRRRPVHCKLRVRRAGNYRVVAVARDQSRRRVKSGFPITFGGERRVAWPRFNHERIEVVADKDRYRPGETAKLVVQSPFARARGILTLERGGVVDHRTFEIRGDTPVLEVPIRRGHAPNVYASVVLLRKRVHDRRDATGFETGAPAFRIGYAELEVEPTFARLDLEVSPEKEVAHPGRPLSIDLRARRPDGSPASGRAVVMVVDEAVLGLTGYESPDALSDLFAPRALGVRTGSSRLDLPHSRRERHEPIFPGGGGGPGFGLGKSERSPEVRDVFASTAFFDAGVDLGADGRARVEVDLPDNVTTFRVMAVAVDQRTRAGSAEAQVVVRKPVMVRAAMPRFAYPGDRVRIEAVVHNGTDRDQPARISAGFAGLRARGELTRRGEVPAGGQKIFAFPIEVVGREEARVRLSARLGGHSDLLEVKLPILEPGTRRRRVAKAQVAKESSLEVQLPAERIPGTSRLELMVSSTRLSALEGAVDYLMGYPNGCIEQTTSRAYPLVVLEDLLPDMGVEVDQKKLDEYAKAGVERILSFQTTSGGLSYWPGKDEPHAFGTAFGLTALIAARERGYEIPDRALSRMADFLEEKLRSGEVTERIPHGGLANGDTRALFVMTLGRLGRPQPSYVSSLWRQKDALTAFGLSLLAVAVDEGSGDRALLEPILAEIRERAIEKRAEAYFEGKRDGGWSMGSPLRTHAGALLAYAGARPGHPMKPKLLSGLLARQQRGLWGNTQENVFGIMAVAEAVANRRGGERPSATLRVNGSRRSLAGAEKVSDRVRKLVLEEAALGLVDGEAASQVVQVENRAGTPLFVTARADYEVPLTEATMAPVEKGFRVSRRYETTEGRPLQGGKLPLGSLVVVRLRIESDSKQNYVAVYDRLPAGLEALNTELATTQSVDREVSSDAEARGLAVLDYSEVRDARVSFYANELAAGTYELTYLARATTAGTFLRPAAGAEAMYEPEVRGASAIDRVVIE